MQGDFFVAAATISAALFTLFGSIFIYRKTAEQSVVMHRANDEQQRALSILSAQIGLAVHRSNTTYGKKLEVLSEAYGKLGEIVFSVERYLVPYTSNSTSRSLQQMQDVCSKFEELRKFYLMTSIFFDSDDQLGKNMGTIMAEINRISNLQSINPNTGVNPNWEQQVISFQDVIFPAMESVKVQFRKTLEIDL